MISRLTPRYLAILLSALCLPAMALTLAPASWPEMLRMADCVVLVRIASVQSEPTEERGAHGIRTRVRFDQLRVLAGNAGEHGVELLLPGGTLNGRSVHVSGAPEFTAGERAVLFLRAGDLAGTSHLCGYGLGVLRVRNERVVPDIPVAGGPPASGENLRDFLRGFPAPEDAPAPAKMALVHQSAQRPWLTMVVLAAIILLLIAGFTLRKWRRTTLVAATAGALLSGLHASHPLAAPPASRDGFTYVLDGRKWDLNTPLLDRVSGGRILWFEGMTSKDLSATDAFSTIAASFQKWEDVPASAVAFSKAGISIDAGSANDQRNVISFLAKPPRSAFDSKTLAITFLIGDPATSTFTDTDTVFNDRDVTWTASGGRFSLDVVSLHEIGHILGLAHSSNMADVMFPVAQGVTALSVSDQAGAAVLYPLNTVQSEASAYACPRLGAAPLTVYFSSDGSTAGTDTPLNVQWDFGDGSPLSTELNPVHAYSAPGTYTATLTLPGTLAPPSETQIRVLAPTGSPSVKNFQYQVSLLSSVRGTDRVTVTVDNVDLASGDSITLMLGGVAITSQQASAARANSAAIRAPNAGIRDGIPGRLAAKFNPLKKELTLILSNAALGRTFDFRDPSNDVQSGTIMLPFNLLITHADSSMTLYSTTVTFNFSVKVGKSSVGTVEKSIQAKKQ